MNRADIKTLKEQVEYVLDQNPETRNCDKVLTVKLWMEFYKPFIKSSKDSQKALIFLEDVLNLPSQDGIKRVRATIQNDEKRFPPTDPQVAKQRGWQEDEWREALGYEPKNRQ